MTEKKLAELLGIEQEKIKRNQSGFLIFDASIQEIDLSLWNQNLSLKFLHCEFKGKMIFPLMPTKQAVDDFLVSNQNWSEILEKNKISGELLLQEMIDKNPIKIDLFFQECIFEDFIKARNSIFEGNFICQACFFNKSVDFSGAEFRKQVDFGITNFKERARFIETKFLGNENNFRETEFEGNAIFYTAEFNGKVNFEIASFKNEASFIGAKFLGNENNFRGAQFEDSVDFSGAEFRKQVDFGITNFKERARFIETKFLGNENNFRETEFEGDANFSTAEFNGKVNFEIASFKSKTSFIGAKFLGNENNFCGAQFEDSVDFSGAEFRKQVDFGITNFKERASFIGAKFLGNENNFRETEFEGDANFSTAEFNGKVNFEIASFKSKTSFIGAKFLGNENNFCGAQFEDDAIFYTAEFNGKVNFEIASFKNEASFIGVKFLGNENKFIGTQFVGNTTFSNTTLNGGVDFIRTKFLGNTLWCQNISDKNVNFQSSVFGGITSIEAFEDSKIEIIDFLNCTFGNQFNIDHQYLKLDYQELKSKIDQGSKDKDKSDQSNIWRDLFRKLKSNRLAYHNLIDASELRAQELYAREIELDSKNPPIFSKDWIEKWQLWFYRHTSDHHTDLMRIISWVIAVIGMFGLISFGIKCYQDPSTFSRLNPYAVNLSLWGTIFLLIPYLIGWIKSFFIFAGSVGLIPILWIVCYRPSLIFGAVNLVDKAPRSVLENIVLVLYTLIMILLLFSLQKTARKNSIIPN